MSQIFEIRHRVSGRVLFDLTAESLRLCVEEAVKAGADLSGADFSKANLFEVDFFGADLAWANLSGVNLSGANLFGANLVWAAGIIHLGAPDGWHAHAWLRNGWLSIRVGCREMRLDEGRQYWAGKNNRREVMAALDYAETIATLRGWPITEPTQVEAA